MSLAVKFSKKDIEKGLVIPDKLSEDLAEIVGIHFGDGSMEYGRNYTYRLCYALDSRNEEYVSHVKRLFRKVFGIRLSDYTYKDRNCTTLYVFSKALCDFMLSIGTPTSPKKDMLIPVYVFDDERLAFRFLKGLFDTDGCFTLQKDRKYRYLLARFSTGCEQFAGRVHQLLLSLGLRSYICRKKSGFDVTIRNKESMRHFIDKVRPEKRKKLGLQGFEP